MLKIHQCGGVRRSRAAVLALGVAGVALACGSAVAQVPDVAAPAPNPPPKKAAKADVEEIAVTGTRIRGVAPTGSTLIGISQEQIQQTGAVNVEQALQTIPQVTNLGITDSSRTSPGGAGNITYASGINIRGIGPYATLMLFDGHRVVQAGSSGGLPDPSDIPILMLSRIELIPDGASAIYGSDAVAGVANLIPKRNADDIEMLARYGFANNYSEHSVDVEGAHKWDTGQFTLVVEDSAHTDLNGANRSFYSADLVPRGGNDYRTPNCSPANILVGTTSYALPGLQANTQNLCDGLKNQDLIPEQQRDNAALTINQKVTDWLDVFGDGLVSQRFVTFRTATPNGIVTVPNTNPFFIAPPGTNPTSEQVETNFGDIAPQQGSQGEERLDQFTGGFTVHLPYGFRLVTDYTYGEDDAKSVSTTGLNNGALAGALNSTNPATAYNPYGVGPANNKALGNQIFNQLFFAPGDNRLEEGEVKLDGPIYTLPAGDARIAVGGEYDYQSLHTGFTSGVPPMTFGSRVFDSQQVHAVYGELFLPIFSKLNALPLLNSLDVDVAGRYENYNNFGSTTNPKIGVNWAPVDGLTLHGSYGTSFRAPTLSSVHGALNGLFVQPYATPNGIVEGVALSGLQQGNQLQPETAKTYSAGADYRPPFLPDLRVSVNYFNIDYEKQISDYLSDLTILSTAQRQSQFASIIRTGAAAQATLNQYVAEGYPVFGALPSSVQYFVFGQNINLGKTLADGLDLSANYKLPTPERYGTINVTAAGTYFLDYRVAVTPTAPLLNEANNLNNPVRFRMRDSVDWRLGPVDGTLFINFTNPYNNNAVTPVQRVGALTTLDLHVSYDLGEQFETKWARGTVFSLDIQNLADTNPPFVNIAESSNGGGGFDPTNANPIGRLVAFSLDKKF